VYELQLRLLDPKGGVLQLNYQSLIIGILLIPASFWVNRRYGTRLALIATIVAVGNLYFGFAG
jgi:hypothetical protein